LYVSHTLGYFCHYKVHVGQSKTEHSTLFPPKNREKIQISLNIICHNPPRREQLSRTSKVFSYKKNIFLKHQKFSWTKRMSFQNIMMLFNSLTPKSVPAGMKNSCWEGFLLAKHKHTNIPTMMEPFALQRHGFVGQAYPPPGASAEGVGHGRCRRDLVESIN
jgi:hypothetical protein